MSDRVAIMNEGVIEQCGTPEDVYEHPTSVLRRRVHRHQQPDARHLRPAAAVHVTAERLPSRSPAHRLGDGEPGQRRDPAGEDLALRPHPGMTRVPGTIVATDYHGATTSTSSIAPGITLTVLEQNPPADAAKTAGAPATASRSAGCPSTPWCCGEPPGRRRRRRRARRSPRARDLEAGGAQVTVLEARDRVGGRVEQVELARRPPRPARRRGRGQRPHRLPRPGRRSSGLTLTASYVAEPGEITRQVRPAKLDRRRRMAVLVHRRRPRVVRRGGGGAREGRWPRSTPRTRGPARTSVGWTGSASATGSGTSAPRPACCGSGSSST